MVSICHLEWCTVLKQEPGLRGRLQTALVLYLATTAQRRVITATAVLSGRLGLVKWCYLECTCLYQLSRVNVCCSMAQHGVSSVVRQVIKCEKAQSGLFSSGSRIKVFQDLSGLLRQELGLVESQGRFCALFEPNYSYKVTGIMAWGVQDEVQSTQIAG